MDWMTTIQLKASPYFEYVFPVTNQFLRSIRSEDLIAYIFLNGIIDVWCLQILIQGSNTERGGPKTFGPANQNAVESVGEKAQKKIPIEVLFERREWTMGTSGSGVDNRRKERSHQ